MATRPGTGRARRGAASSLSTDQVTEILARHAATVPLSTTGVTDFCMSRHPDMHITHEDTTRLLLWLHRHHRVQRWSGHETHTLEREGVVNPEPRRTYWRLRRTIHAEDA